MFQVYKKYWLNYANFEGKSTRSDFWWVVLCNFLISVPLVVVGVFQFFIATTSYAGTTEYMSEDFSLESISSMLFVLLIYMIWRLVTLIPNLALEVRRYRDAGLSWGFIFLNLGEFAVIIPLIGWLINLGCQIVRLVLLTQPSKEDLAGLKNTVSDEPKNETNEDSLSKFFEE